MTARLILHGKIDGTFALSVFKNNTEKVCEIPLGSDKKAAVKTANDMVYAFVSVGEDGYTDQT